MFSFFNLLLKSQILSSYSDAAAAAAALVEILLVLGIILPQNKTKQNVNHLVNKLNNNIDQL